jgi:hypothetical protein
MDPVVKLVVEIAGILLLGALGEFIFARTRVPDVVWLVVAGILAGPVSGLIPAGLLKPGVPFFGAIALTVILSSGAFRLQLNEVAAAAPRGIFLGLSGFVFSLIAICGFLWLSTELGYVRPAPPLAWLMAGAIVAGTSSVIIMPTMAMARVPSRVARMLEVESSATDALSVVVTMVLIDLLVSGSADISRPFIALTRELGVGVALGVIAAALLVPGIPSMRDRPHGYTVFLASMLALYGITDLFRGNGAMAVLVASLLVGNASSIVPRLFPGAYGLEFTATENKGHAGPDDLPYQVVLLFFDRPNVPDGLEEDCPGGCRSAVPHGDADSRCAALDQEHWTGEEGVLVPLCRHPSRSCRRRAGDASDAIWGFGGGESGPTHIRSDCPQRPRFCDRLLDSGPVARRARTP